MVAESLKTAKIDIVGGDNKFFDSIVNSITAGRQVDRLVGGSEVLSDVKETFFNGDPEHFKVELQRYIDMFGVSSEDLKNLTVSALIGQLMGLADDDGVMSKLSGLMSMANRAGLSGKAASSLSLKTVSK